MKKLILLLSILISFQAFSAVTDSVFEGTVTARRDDGSKLLNSIRIKSGNEVMVIKYFAHNGSTDYGLYLLRNNTVVGQEVNITLDCSAAALDGNAHLITKANGKVVRKVIVNHTDSNLCTIVDAYQVF